MSYQLFLGDCLDILPTLPDASVDCVISDPPYPCIKRDYGMMTESAWMDMMQEVVRQTRRILKPTGSAVFILQPNSERVGRMRLWLWKFMVWAGEEWGIVQDAYWWNVVTLPSSGATQAGLMRGSVKPCVWLGNADCYRDQSSVLFGKGEWHSFGKIAELGVRAYGPSGHSVNYKTVLDTAIRRGGVTPFNVLPIANNLKQGASAHGHGAGTPLKLADWWTRYICPPGGIVADWFTGSGTMGLAALQNGCSFVGIEKMPKYYEIAKMRLDAEAAKYRQSEMNI